MDSLNTYIDFGIGFSIILGSFLHFTYQLSGKNKIVGYFSATNESVWEHTKLAVVPILITTIFIYSKLHSELNNLFLALAIGAVLPIIIIPSLFYLYTFFTKHPILPVDIGIFVISIIVTLKLIGEVFLLPQVLLSLSLVSIIILIFTLDALLKFTYNPPDLKIFK